MFVTFFTKSRRRIQFNLVFFSRLIFYKYILTLSPCLFLCLLCCLSFRNIHNKSLYRTPFIVVYVVALHTARVVPSARMK